MLQRKTGQGGRQAGVGVPRKDILREGHLSKPERGLRARPADVWGKRNSNYKSEAAVLPAWSRTGQEAGLARTEWRGARREQEVTEVSGQVQSIAQCVHSQGGL